jgi:hypothetical protein
MISNIQIFVRHFATSIFARYFRYRRDGRSRCRSRPWYGPPRRQLRFAGIDIFERDSADGEILGFYPRLHFRNVSGPGVIGAGVRSAAAMAVVVVGLLGRLL